MKAVFDTNILIDYLNGIESASVELSLYDKRLISVITFIEVMAGAKNPDEEKQLRGFLTSFEMLDLSPVIADEVVTLRRKFRLKIPDAIVYATARINECQLVTRNVRDLRLEWPDVRVPYTI